MKNLILKILPIALAVVVLQLAVAAESKAAPPAWGCSNGGDYYVVCYGDTLYSIGRQYNVDPYCVAQANGLWDPNYIYAGQVLYIPGNCNPYPWHPVSCGWDCNQGWHQPRDNRCDNNDCGGDGWDHNSRWDCGNNDCNKDGWNNSRWDCGNDCNKGGWGYDRTGYYYDHWNQGYQRYNYTCGYGGNCY